ncbi:hypothetical protein [Rhodococcoides kyotonense]|uniref:Uncharacterized protein n=1 Tax=Rhodococcoides kyotonense TaxID=398843 RepID=A0A239ER31_9NOCA|nr:hypothetical protein [Rhodococcus kyotonensis]SNS47220.1 hypothetical protein SAMN05421642_102527 [Rhodococcus kyotonensis]
MRKLSIAVILVVLGAAGLFNGMSLVSDPTGRSLGLRVDMLPPWHSWDFLVSGMFVLIALGIVPLICAAAVLVDVPEAAAAAGAIGVVVIAWVAWQILVLDLWVPRAHVALAGGAVALIVLGATMLHHTRFHPYA